MAWYAAFSPHWKFMPNFENVKRAVVETSAMVRTVWALVAIFKSIVSEPKCATASF